MSQPIETTIKQSQTIGDTSSNWQQTVTFGQFDPALGTLTAIDVGLTADVTGSVSIESLEAAPSTVTVSQRGFVAVDSPTGIPLVTAAPVAGASANLGAYDGNTDNAGASGDALALSNTATEQSQWSAGSIDIGDFVGSGSVALPVLANTSLHVIGPANLALASTASAGAVVDLQYDYLGAGPPGNPDAGSGGSVITSVGVFSVFFANSVTTAPQTITVADSTTGWNTSLAVDRFNPALGTLEAVNITLSGDLSTSVSTENEDATAFSVSVTQAATLALALPGETETTSGSNFNSLNLPGYDGTADFAGTSGTIVANQTQMAILSDQLTDQADLAALAGLGTLTVPLSATGASSLDGPGNLLAKLLAQAGATATVSYTYLPTGVTDTDIAWNRNTSGEWTDAKNWSPNAAAPQSGDDVAITQSGTYVVTLDAAQSIHSLVIDAPDATLVLDADLTVVGDFILDAGTIEFNGSTLSARDITMNGGEMVGNDIDLAATGSLAINSGSLDSSGTVSLQAATLVEIGTLVALGTAQVGSFPDMQIPVVSVASIVIDGTSFPGDILLVQCFARGTRIASPRGAIPVETLSIGDSVLLASGDTAPITWIGYREVDCRRHPQPHNVWPVRISRGAFGDAGPQRDLLLSPDHAVFANGVLIPVKYLINGRTIRQVRRARIDYFHIELPLHDILLAEGLTVESYLDTGSRRQFANAGVPVLLHPDFSSLAWEAGGCAPLIVTGPQLDVVRQGLDAIARLGRNAA